MKELATQQPKSSPAQPESGIADVDSQLPSAPEHDDFWLSADNDFVGAPEYKTWEGFENLNHESFSQMFISEAGPAVFDALVANKKDPNDDTGDILDNTSYCACLLTLALGRSSLLFTWDQPKNSFVKTAPRLRTSGLTLDLVRALDKLCLDCGNCIRHLQYFSEATYAASATPTRIALAGVIDRLVITVRSELSVRSRNVKSILQLQSLVRPVQSILSYFKSLVKKVAPQKSDEAMLSCLFEEVQSAEYRNGLLRATTREVLKIVSRPWIEFVEEWTGLRNEQGIPITKEGPGKGFVKVADKMWVDDQGFELEEADYFLDPAKVPTFLPEDMVNTIFETGRNIRFLREHHPDHPLSRPDTVDLASPPKLEWQFDWDALSKLEARVAQYRDAVARALDGTLQTSISDSSATPPSPVAAADLTVFGQLPSQIQSSLLASLNKLNQPLKSPSPTDPLSSLLHSHLYSPLDSTSLDPHSSLIPHLSFNPLIQAQSTLINQACIALLFTHHNLRQHIGLLHQYFLLSNGLLVSRLSHALFDPDVSTAERKAGVALRGGMMGLRLGGRKTWPPASSELRLALMGVLVDCYAPFQAEIKRGQNKKAEKNTLLPGDLSFAVRGDLSQEEIDRCMDADGLEALDFLRLTYTAPKGLGGVIVPGVLVKFDRIFRLLLRVMRMGWVVNELFRVVGDDVSDGDGAAALRFGIEARHLVNQIMRYFFETGIRAPWDRFQEWLDGVEAEVNKGEGKFSPDIVRDRLDGTLDEIMSVLLLRKRQMPIMKLLEEVFGVVLRFSRVMRIRRVERHLKGKETELLDSPEEMYKVLRKKIGVFITVLRGLSEKMAAGGVTSGKGTKGRRGENTVEQLLVMLDMEGFYGKK